MRDEVYEKSMEEVVKATHFIENNFKLNVVGFEIVQMNARQKELTSVEFKIRFDGGRPSLLMLIKELQEQDFGVLAVSFAENAVTLFKDFRS